MCSAASHARISRRSAWFVIVLIVCLVVTGCGSAGTATPTRTALPSQPGSTAQASATAAPATATRSAATTATVPAVTRLPSTAPTPTSAQPAPVPTKTVAAKWIDPDQLDSYRMKMTTWPKGEDKSRASVIQIEWVKAQKAKRTVTGEGASAVEVITIGDMTYVKIMGRWVQQEPTTSAQSQQQADDISRLLEEKYILKDTGRETVNGVACRKVSYSGEATITVPDGPMKGEITASGKGELWIADQAGLPAVVVRNRGESVTKMKSPTGAGEQTIAINTEIDLTDINQPIVIQAPQDVMIPPALPVARSATATKPAPGTATLPAPTTPIRTATPAITANAAVTRSPQAAATVPADTYTADFDGSYDRSWFGTPGMAAEVSTGARPGFVRFSAGSGNDLFPATNLDAPTLWRLVTGAFTAETAVDFEPNEDYQGAGLFAWQDATNFVRLERCYGGMGGGGSGICFIKVENGEPKLIADGSTVATDASRVELRLRFSGGDTLTAWWHDAASGPAFPWQEVGSTALPLRSAPQAGMAPGLRVGILLAVEGGSDISADFDWFRLGAF